MIEEIWTLHLKFEEDATDYHAGILKDGFSFSESVGRMGKHAMQTCSVSILDSIIAAKVFNTKKNIDASIHKGNTVVFEGVIRPCSSLRAERARELPLELEVIDYSQLLRCYVYTDMTELSNITEELKNKCIQTITYTDINVGDLITRLFNMTKINQRVRIVVPAINITKNYFCLEAGSYMDEVIEQLLYEYCMDYRFTPGVLTVYSTAVVDSNSVPVAPSDSISNFNLSFNVTRNDVSYDGVVVNYGDYIAQNTLLYSEDNRWDKKWWELNIGSASYKKGYYYNRSMNASLEHLRSVRWTFPQEYKDYTVVGISNLYAEGAIQDESGVSYTAHCIDFDKDEGKPYIAYEGIFNHVFGKGWGFVLKVYGIVLYRNPSLKYESIYGMDPVNETTKFIERMEDAKLLARNIQARNEKAQYEYSFSSFKALVPGTIVNLTEDKVTGLKTVVRIVSRSFDPMTKLYSYKAEGAGEVSIPEIFSGGVGQNMPSDSGPSYLFELSASKTSFIVEEADSEITVTATGILFSQFKCTPQWSFNGSILDSNTTIIKLRKSLLKIGVNEVKCSTIYEGSLHERALTLTLISSSLDMSELYEWQKTSTLDPPVPRENFFVFGDSYLSWDEFTIVLDDNWKKEMPNVAPDEFLWMRVPTADGDYAVIRMTGNPYQDFSIYSDPTVYQNSKRLTTDRRVSIGVSYGNIKNPVIEYQLVGSPKGVQQDSTLKNVFYIKAGQTPAEFTVNVTIVGIGMKPLTIKGVDVPENAAMYVGRTDIMPPAVTDTLLVDGDWVLYMGVDTATYKKGHAYKKAGDNWIETTNTKELADVYWDTKDLQKDNIFARVVFAESLLAENVSVLGEFRFQKDVGDNRCLLTISRDGFEATYGPKTNGKNPGIFSFDFDTGKVFIGNPNQDKTEPVSGFMYDPSSGLITSAGGAFEIGEGGHITTNSMSALYLNAFNASISGDSKFNGDIDCGSIKTEKIAEIVIPMLSNYRAYNQAEQLYFYLCGELGRQVREADELEVRVNVKAPGIDTNVEYLRISRIAPGDSLISSATTCYFYDASHSQVRTDSIGSIKSQNLKDDGKYLYFAETIVGRMYAFLDVEGIHFDYIKGGNVLIMNVKDTPAVSELRTGEVYSNADGILRIKR